MEVHNGYRINSILADPDITTRIRLKQATTAVPQFAEVAQVNTLQESVYKLEGDVRWDVVFISYKFDLQEVKKFVEQAKHTKQGELATFVLVLKSKDQDKSTVANAVMMGIDGFLFEPYSVESLVEMTELARKMRVERGVAKEKMATTLLVTDIMEQLNLVAYLKSCGYSVSKSGERLKELCGNLRKCNPEYERERLETTTKLLIDAPAPKNAFGFQKYGGVSERVKARMEKKIAARAVVPGDRKA